MLGLSSRCLETIITRSTLLNWGTHMTSNAHAISFKFASCTLMCGLKSKLLTYVHIMCPHFENSPCTSLYLQQIVSAEQNDFELDKPAIDADKSADDKKDTANKVSYTMHAT